MAAAYTLQINRGEDLYKTFQWLQGDGETPVNLRGYSGQCQIRNGAFNQGLITEINVEIIEAEQGRFALKLSAEQTKKIPITGYDFSELETYAYDVYFLAPNGISYRTLNGQVKISPGVTR